MVIETLVGSITIVQGILFLVGIALVILEMFIPGFGIPGILGGIVLLAAIILTANTVTQMIILTIIILAILGIAFTIVLILFTKGKITNVVLEEKLDKERGYIGTEDLDYFIGKEGTTTSVLRPSGTADFQGVRMDVVSEGDFIELNEKIKVIKVQGRRIVVKKL
ncbi:NfeD family protein [Clostridium hydrogeniformans]|uniref:NfeD family protein n=1 Tax=Clostridium hydrogeniformans TaxID=349933 RepID=UPI00048407A4|nr:NfeD family protein [Clostridium hydrogeniformans]